MANNDEDSAKIIFNAIKAEYLKHETISYNIELKSKSIAKDDTTAFNGTVKMIRTVEDTVFGGVIWLRNKKNIEKYYNLTSLFTIDNNAEEITEYDATKNETFPLTENYDSDLIKAYFLKPWLLGSYFKISSGHQMEHKLLNHEPCWKINFDHYSDQFVTDSKTTFWVGKKDTIIKKVSNALKFQGKDQYIEWNFSEIRFNTFCFEELESDFIEKFKKYTVQQFVKHGEKYYALLELGKKAPDFEGYEYFQQQAIKLNSYKGKVILLDFWYSACFPCILSIPGLNALYNKYKNDGFVVLGVNSYDKKENRQAKLPNFLQYNKIDYPILLVEKDVESQYLIKFYPTIYILDKEGKIVYSKSGYIKNQEEQLESIIVKALSQ